MINLQSLLNFALWSGYANADAMLAAYNKTQPLAFELNISDKVMLDRAILTLGQSYPIDQERQAAGQAPVTRLYRNKLTHAIVDGASLAGADMSKFEEMVATEDGWYPLGFVRANMDAEILAGLTLTPWPTEQLMLRMYRLLHQLKHGVDFSLADLMLAAEQVRLAEDVAKDAQEAPDALVQDEPELAANVAENEQEGQ